MTIKTKQRTFEGISARFHADEFIDAMEKVYDVKKIVLINLNELNVYDKWRVIIKYNAT